MGMTKLEKKLYLPHDYWSRNRLHHLLAIMHFPYELIYKHQLNKQKSKQKKMYEGFR